MFINLHKLPTNDISGKQPWNPIAVRWDIMMKFFALAVVLLFQSADSFLHPASSRSQVVAPWGVRTAASEKTTKFSPTSDKLLQLNGVNFIVRSNASTRALLSATALFAAPKIVIAGAPASGKGTQCEKIQERLGVVHLSTGDMLRAAVSAGTDVGKEAKAYMDSGKLVPDSTIIGVVR